MLGVKQFAPDIFFRGSLYQRRIFQKMNAIDKEKLMSGLSSQQADESKRKYGTNEQAKKETESL